MFWTKKEEVKPSWTKEQQAEIVAIVKIAMAGDPEVDIEADRFKLSRPGRPGEMCGRTFEQIIKEGNFRFVLSGHCTLTYRDLLLLLKEDLKKP